MRLKVAFRGIHKNLIQFPRDGSALANRPTPHDEYRPNPFDESNHARLTVLSTQVDLSCLRLNSTFLYVRTQSPK